MREKYSKQDITSDVMNKCRERLKDFYKATPAATRVKYDTAKLKYEANNANGRKPKRHCSICQEKGLTQYMSTHDTKYHEDDWKPKNLEKGNNKELSSYFIDSGANAHIFKDAPYNCKPATGTVMTAGGRTEQIIRTGEFKGSPKYIMYLVLQKILSRSLNCYMTVIQLLLTKRHSKYLKMAPLWPMERSALIQTC
jgi:hypothetical protein